MKHKDITNVRQIAGLVTKKYFDTSNPDDYITIEIKKDESGHEYIEARTELTSYEGGFEFMEAVAKKLDLFAEYYGMCIYHFYPKIAVMK